MSKLIHSASLAGFKTAFPNWAYTDIDSTNPNSSYKSVVYTDDGYLYTHGKIFRIFADGPTIFTANRTNNTVTLTETSGAHQTLGTFDIGISALATGSTATIITSTTDANGIATISHATSSLNSSTLGAEGNSNTSIAVPKIITDSYGHLVFGTTQYTATLNQVQTDSTTNSANYYVAFAASSSSGTSVLNKVSSIYVNPNTGELHANTLYQGNNALVDTYANLNTFNTHTTTYADSNTYGHVKLLDTYSATYDTSQHIAATPKSVKTAYDDAVAYANNILSANDAMIFKGTIGTGGTVTSLPSSGYQSGWTYRVITDGFTFGSNKCETGDLIICVKDYAIAYADSDWTVAQTNIDGAVTTSGTLTANTVILGTGSKTISSLTNGSDGTVLSLVNGVPTWSTDRTRSIQLEGSEILSSTSSTPLNFVSGSNISISNSSGSLTFSATGLVTSNSLQNLIFTGNDLSSTTQNWIYGPTSGKTLTFDNDLYLTSTGHVGHKHQIDALNSQKLGSITYDSNGHITAFTEITSLPSPTNLYLKINNGTTEDNDLYTYNGANSKTLNIISGANVSFSTSTNSLTINSSYVNTVSSLSIGSSGTLTNDETSNGGTYLKLIQNGNYINNSFLIQGTGATSVISDSSGNITISSSNTWRKVTAYSLSDNTSGQILTNSIATADLDFGSEFLWDATGGSGNDGQLRIGWAEIADNGTITYTV